MENQSAHSRFGNVLRSERHFFRVFGRYSHLGIIRELSNRARRTLYGRSVRARKGSLQTPRGQCKCVHSFLVIFRGPEHHGVMPRPRSTPKHKEAASTPIRWALLGLPCANCKLYYEAYLKVCPVCSSTERLPPTATKPPVSVITTSATQAAQQEFAFLGQVG